MRPRILVVFLLLIGMWSLLAIRGAVLQVFPNEKLAKLKARQFQRKVKLSGRRGLITDRNGNELAISITAYSLFADPKLIANPKAVSRKLSKLLNIPYRVVYKKIRKKRRRFQWIKRRLRRETRDKIAAWKNRGLGFIEEAERVYPNGQLMANVIGFVGVDSQGLEGIEKQYQDHLAGQEHEVTVRRDAKGRPLVVDLKMFNEDRNGMTVELTIDRDLQYHLEKELKKSVLKNRAESAVGVILDVETSEVLAMANYPTFDPNEPHKVKPRWRKNRTVTDAFEPGSTMKTILMGAALKAKKITPNKRYFCENGKFRIGRRVIGEADARHSQGWLTTTEILAHSSNIGATKVGFDLGEKTYRRTLGEFGFGVRTGIDFPGEFKGILNPLPWGKHLLANVSFGHGVTSTPLQMALAYAAIANGGVWRSPRLLKSLKNQWGEEVELTGRSVTEPIVERRVLSKADATQLTLMLSTVTGAGGGTVATARVPGFPVAGKTGTAQKVRTNGRGYEKGAYISSFAGFVPAHAPKYVIYIAVDDPKRVYYGSQVAAPVFSKLAGFALRRAGMTPVLISEKNLLSTKTEAEVMQKRAVKRLKTHLKGRKNIARSRVPALKGLTLREVLLYTKDERLVLKMHGHGVVSRTSPPAGFPVPREKPVEVFLSLSQ